METSGQVEMAADHLRDRFDRHALIGDGMESRTRRGFFESQAEQAGGVKPVHGRPAVGPVADVAGDALVASYGNNRRP